MSVCLSNSLNLSGNALDIRATSAVAALLSARPSLTSLDLADNNLGVPGVRVLADEIARDDCALVRLSLARNGAGAVGAAFLGKAIRAGGAAGASTALTHLNLEGNGLNDAAMAAIDLKILTIPDTISECESASEKDEDDDEDEDDENEDEDE